MRLLGDLDPPTVDYNTRIPIPTTVAHTNSSQVEGGGWNAIRYQILYPLKNQISDIRLPKKNQISDITRSQRNPISCLKNQISDPKKNQLSDITPPTKIKYQIDLSRYPRSPDSSRWSIDLDTQLNTHYLVLQTPQLLRERAAS